MSLEIIREVSQQTRLKAQRNARLIFAIGGSTSALLTLVFYSLGIVQEDSLYNHMPLIISIPLVLMSVFNAIMFTSLAILFLKSFGEYSAPKVIDGYWHVASKLILRERFKKNTAEGIWDYVKLHRKHDPLYQADLEKLQSQINKNTQKINQLILENTQLKTDIEKINTEFVRKSKIDDLARKKLRSLKNQAERERDEVRKQNTKLTNLIRKLLSTIFKLELIIKKLKGE